MYTNGTWSGVRILGKAEQDFAESIAYYESKEPGLGWRFRNEVAEVVKRILRHPEFARLRPEGYRRNASATRSPPRTAARSFVSPFVCGLFKTTAHIYHVPSVN